MQERLRKHSNDSLPFRLQVRETIRDSATGEESMKIGHHVNERGHVVEKKRRGGGTIEERNQYIGINEGMVAVLKKHTLYCTYSRRGAFRSRPGPGAGNLRGIRLHGRQTRLSR